LSQPASGDAFEPKPMPRSILKQRTVDTAPSVTASAAPSTRASSQAPRFEFTGSRDVPIYDDWEHAPAVRPSNLAATVTSQSLREEHSPAATPTSPMGRGRVVGDTYPRQRSTGASKHVTSNRTARARTPSPSKGNKSATKPAKSDLVPVLSDKIIRTKAQKPTRLSTTLVQTSNGAYVEPLTSPILLACDNYSVRMPENTVYQYDVRISPSEPLTPSTRRKIVDALQKTIAPEVFPPLARASFDGKMMYAHRRLNVSSRQVFDVELSEPSQEHQAYKVRLKRMAEITPNIAPVFRY